MLDRNKNEILYAKLSGFGEPQVADMHARYVFLTQAPAPLIAAVRERFEMATFGWLAIVTSMVPVLALLVTGLGGIDMEVMGWLQSF